MDKEDGEGCDCEVMMKVIMKVMKITMKSKRMVTTGNTECICCISLFRHTAGTTKKQTPRNPSPELFF